MRFAKFVFTGLALAACSGALARPTDFADRSKWESAAGAFNTIDFSELPATTLLRDQYLALGVRFSGSNFAVSDSAFADHAGARGTDNYITFSFLQPINVVAVGSFGQSMMVLYSGGDMVRTTYLGHTSSSREFGGVVSSVPFDRVVISNRYQGQVEIDDLRWSLVPGPAGAWILVLAAAIAARRRF